MAQIRRWSPFAELEAFRREMDRILREFFGEERAPAVRGWTPAVDIYETPNEIVVQAELPGIRREDIQIELTDERLTLRGKRERVTEESATYRSWCKRSSAKAEFGRSEAQSFTPCYMMCWQIFSHKLLWYKNPNQLQNPENSSYY